MIKLAYVFIAFPYLFATPLFLGIQPWALILCSTYLLLNWSKINLNSSLLFLIFFSVLLFILSLTFLSYLSFGFIVSILCPVIFLIFYKLTSEDLTLNFLNGVLLIYFLFAFLYLISPDIFESIHRALLSQYRVEGGMARGTGAAFFAPEPGLGAGILSMTTLAWLTRLPEKKNIYHLICFILISFCIYLTKSGTGYVFFFFIVSYYVFSISGSKLASRLLTIITLFFISIFLYFLYSIGFFESNHGFKVLSLIFSSDIPETSSTGRRIWSLLSAYEEIRLYAFGNIERIISGVENIRILNPGYPTNISRMIYAFGYLGLLYYFFLYFNLRCSIQMRVFTLLSIAILFPISTPSIIFFLNKSSKS